MARGPRASRRASRSDTRSDIERLREIFDMFDRDGGGTVDEEEIGQIMRTLGHEPTPTELQELIAKVDESGSGDVEFNEFVKLWRIFIHRFNQADRLVMLRRKASQVIRACAQRARVQTCALLCDRPSPCACACLGARVRFS